MRRMSVARPLCLFLAASAPLGVQACGNSEPAHDTGTGAGRPSSTAAPARPVVAWTREAVLHGLDRRRVPVRGQSVSIDAGTLTCVGIGPAAMRVGGRPAWTRFRCVQPTFPRGEVVGPDLIFFVEPTGPRSFLVRAPRLTTY